VHDQCASDANRASEDCVSKIQNETNYISCSCPNWPVGNFACNSVCQSAYNRAQSCSSVSAARESRCDDSLDTCSSGC
jgi:hypothetical protein